MNKNKKSSRQVKKNMLYYESKQTANIANATVAELVDALDSKSSGKPCGFESHFGHQNKNVAKATFFIFTIIMGLEKEVAKFRAGLGPAETKAKIILWIIFPTRVV